MTTLYVSQRRPTRRESRATFMHHVAWGIVCAVLIAFMFGLWSYAQSLESKNRDLKRQLVVAKEVPTQTTCKVAGQWIANSTKELSVDTRDGKRGFIVHTPADFADNKYYPMIMFYPGKNASAQAAELAYGLDALPALLVYPFPTTGIDGFTSWASAPYSSGADDVGFTAAILDKLQAELCIDKTRVYAAGMSNGGGFASLLSCELPERFAAYAIVAGALYAPSSDCKPSKPASILTIHGDSDPIVPFEGSPIRQLPPIYDWSAERARHEKCGKAVIDQPNPVQIITTWEKCRDGAVVQNVRILGGGHAWGDVPNDMLWQFLTRFTL